MTIQDITTLRLHNQRIAGRRAATPLAVAQHMGALQAQDYYGSLWALGVRTGLTEQQIIRALEAREVIRTWPQRGTLHIVPPADAAWMVGLSAERLLRGARRRREGLGLDDETLAKSKEVLVQLLQGDQHATRSQVMAALEDAGVSTTSGRGYHILWYLSQTGVTYIGPMQAKQQTIGLLGDLVPHPAAYSREAAVAELTKRYFTSHGPATLQDFMWWAGLPAREARAGLAANQPALHGESVEGREYWMARPAATVRGDQDSAFLLPGFDEYMLGYKNRSAALPTEHAGKVVPGGNGMFLPTIVVRGQVIGTWKRVVKKDHVQLTLTPFQPLGKAELRLLQAPAEAFGKFMGLPPKLTLA